MKSMSHRKHINPNVMNRFRYSQETAIEKPFNWQQLLRLLQYLKPYSKNLLPKSIIVVLINTAIRLAIPLIIGYLILEKAIYYKDADLLVQLIIIVGVLYLISYLANYYRIRWTNQLGQNVIYDIRKHLFTHVQSLSNNFFDQRSAGSILSVL